MVLLLLQSLEHLLYLVQLILVLFVFLVKLPHHVLVFLLKDHASLTIMVLY